MAGRKLYRCQTIVRLIAPVVNRMNRLSFHGNLTMLQIRNKCRAAGTGRDPWRVLFRLPETNHHGCAVGELVIFSRIMI
jgi:hypothetical protein